MLAPAALRLGLCCEEMGAIDAEEHTVAAHSMTLFSDIIRDVMTDSTYGTLIRILPWIAHMVRRELDRPLIQRR